MLKQSQSSLVMDHSPCYPAGMDNNTLVTLLTLRFRAPWCRNLKDRRAEVQRLLTRLRTRFNVSAVDSGPQDIHSRFDITIAYLSFNSAQSDSIRESLMRLVEENSEAELFDVEEDVF